MLSKNLRRLRRMHGLSQEQVAEKAGVSRQAVAKWERGDSTPDLSSCQALAALYSVDTSHISDLFYAPGTDLNATTQIERDGVSYSSCVGYFSRWVDFKAACLSVFTEEYFNYLINSADNMPPQFINVDGDLYYWCGSRGTLRGYWPELYPETFEPVEQTDDFIEFNMLVHYRLPYDENEPPYEEFDRTYTLTMEKTENGWRFSKFELPL